MAGEGHFLFLPDFLAITRDMHQDIVYGLRNNDLTGLLKTFQACQMLSLASYFGLSDYPLNSHVIPSARPQIPAPEFY